jgi:hypothetical protein
MSKEESVVLANFRFLVSCNNWYVLNEAELVYIEDKVLDREYILFRNVEHYGTGSAPGIASLQFQLFPESVPIPFHAEIPGIPSDSALTQFSEFRTGIDPYPHPHPQSKI